MLYGDAHALEIADMSPGLRVEVRLPPGNLNQGFLRGRTDSRDHRRRRAARTRGLELRLCAFVDFEIVGQHAGLGSR